MPAGGKSVFSPHSQSAFSLWKDMDLSDDEVDDSYSITEGKCQTPLPPATKHPHGSLDDETKSPSKKSKVDVSNLYNPGTGSEGDGVPTKEKSEKSKKAKKDKKKHKKNKKHGKDKNKEKKTKEKDKGKSDVKTPEQKTSGDKKSTKKTPVPKTPKKTKLNRSDGEGSGMPAMPKSRKKPIRTVQQCQADKWVADLPSTISYCQQMGISIHNLPEGHNYDNHTDYVRQLLCQENVVNIRSLDEWIQGLQGLTNNHHVSLRTALSD